MAGHIWLPLYDPQSGQLESMSIALSVPLQGLRRNQIPPRAMQHSRKLGLQAQAVRLTNSLPVVRHHGRGHYGLGFPTLEGAELCYSAMIYAHFFLSLTLKEDCKSPSPRPQHTFILSPTQEKCLFIKMITSLALAPWKCFFITKAAAHLLHRAHLSPRAQQQLFVVCTCMHAHSHTHHEGCRFSLSEQQVTATRSYDRFVEMKRQVNQGFLSFCALVSLPKKCLCVASENIDKLMFNPSILWYQNKIYLVLTIHWYTYNFANY